MRNVRIIARMDIKGTNLIKGIQLEGIRVVGDPQTFVEKYYREGIDEIIYMDSVASLYGRNSLDNIVRRAAQNIFIPMTVGGGIRSVADAKAVLRAGADKVALNTAAIHRPQLIRELAEEFGNQCVVLSVEAKHRGSNSWEAYTDNGREKTGRDVREWVQEAVALGAGEVFVTAVDRDGTGEGFDVNLMQTLAPLVEVPIIASGGFGKPEHAVNLIRQTPVDAIAVGHAFHYNKSSIQQLKAAFTAADIPTRETREVSHVS